MKKNYESDIESVFTSSSETTASSCSNCPGDNRNNYIYGSSTSTSGSSVGSSSSVGTSSSVGSSSSVGTSSSIGSSSSIGTSSSIGSGSVGGSINSGSISSGSISVGSGSVGTISTGASSSRGGAGVGVGTNVGGSIGTSSDNNISVCKFSNNSGISSNNSGVYTKNTNNNNNNNKNNRNHTSVYNKITIDVAVLCQEYTTIEKMCGDHIINLDEIEITRDTFQNIFYPYCENFGINKNNVSNNSFYAEYISFLPEYRTVNKKKFYLLEEIISNIENDLSISRNCFTVESLVELTNEIISVNSFCDVNCCSVLSSLTWSNILEIIQNYSIINENCGCDNSSQKGEVIPICVISIVFKTPTPGVKNTIVRFNYKIVDL